MDFRFIPNIFLSNDVSSLTKKIKLFDSYFINEIEMKNWINENFVRSLKNFITRFF